MLLKNETICTSCSKQYILVFDADDLNDISYCPFCGTDVEIEVDEETDS